jgi:hypothetical protein
MNCRLAVRLLIIPAQMARPTRVSERLDSGSITKLEVFYIGADFDNNSSTFMTWGLNAEGRHGWITQVALHHMNIRRTEAREIESNQDIVRSWITTRSIS